MLKRSAARAITVYRSSSGSRAVSRPSQTSSANKMAISAIAVVLKPGDLVRIKAGARNNRGDKLPDALALVSTPLEGEDGST